MMSDPVKFDAATAGVSQTVYEFIKNFCSGLLRLL